MLIDEINHQPVDRPLMTLSAYSIQGKRNHMEDFFDIGYQMKPCDQRRPNEWPYDYFYFGIFDGHGGAEAARFAKQNLLKFITQQKEFWSTDDEDVKRAIRMGFAATHSAMRKEMPSWSRTSRELPSTAGTTASILFIKNGKFYTGHVGDSRIVISRENPETKHWISRQLTEDHKPESEQEMERIQRAGGEVRTKIGVHRVVWKRPVLNYYSDRFDYEEDFDDTECADPTSPSYKITHSVFFPDPGRIAKMQDQISTYPVEESLVESYQTIPFLAIARSLGDFWSLNPYSGQYIVSPEPDVTCRYIQPEDKCILLATDGLWNIMNSSHAVRILEELNISKNGNRHYYDDQYFATDNFYDVAGNDSDNHAQSLVYFAYQIWERRRLRSDNITVVVAVLHDILANFQKSAKQYATRANAQSTTHPSNQNELKLEPNQIGQTNAFLETIRMNSEPKFCLPVDNVYKNRWERLENFLVLPPTLLEQEYDFKYPKLVYPRNYLRLSIAACRRISRLDTYSEAYIYIKKVSDDPADEHKLPTRINKFGKEVRDASAQATQCIHDFGQPWDQLLDEENADANNNDEDLNDNESETAGDDDLDVDDEDDEKDQAELVKKTKEDEKNIPQLRCLLNYTPPPRRSTRSTYLSVSDNAKRKVQYTSGSSIQKSKRRKSQPVRYNLART